ncbi:class A beta-lactamase-related serine hydrolase [bacterium]|nr:class A beta-lactamase-related serine hydrolase [bacterium]
MRLDYGGVSRTNIYVILCSVFVMLSHAYGEPHGEDPVITAFENSLLPSVLIEGEPPYNLQDRMAHYNMPGVSVAVIVDYDVKWVKHYGYRDAELREPITDSTIFCVGSLSKAVAAATILHLVEEGTVALDDDVNRYLKSWRVPENEFTRNTRVTIGRLMNHSAGFGTTPGHSFVPDKMPSLIDYLNATPPLNVPPARIEYEPGTAFRYANAGFAILQILAEDVTGMRYNDFAREVLLGPLGMTYSTFEQPLSSEKELYASAGHKSNGRVQEIKRYATPAVTAGGLWSTAVEYARFVIEIQRALKGESDLIMSKELARLMTSPHEAKEYGYGVFMRYTDSVTYFGHIGDFRGFVAGFLAHPTDGYGVVVMTNNNNGIGLVREITSAVAMVYRWESALPRAHEQYPLDSETVASRVGRYRIGFDAVCSIEQREGRLFCSLPGEESIQLYAISKDTMVTKDRLGQIVFASDADGMVESCTPHFADVIGRLPATTTKAKRMSDEEKTPLQLVLSGDMPSAVQMYREHKHEAPDDPHVSEDRLNRLGYQLMSQDKLSAALTIFKLNTELYPESGNCWDSYAESLVAAGFKQDALTHYRKALELDPSNGNAAKWIERLESEQ